MKHLYISHVILGVLIGMSVHGIQCEFKKRKWRFNTKSLKIKKTNKFLISG